MRVGTDGLTHSRSGSGDRLLESDANETELSLCNRSLSYVSNRIHCIRLDTPSPSGPSTMTSKPTQSPSRRKKSAAMRRRVPVKLTPYDSVNYLKSDRAIAAYLNDALADGNPAEVLMAFSQVARARGMSRVSKASGLGRESLYKALSPRSKPRFDTIFRLAHALGLELVAEVACRDRPVNHDHPPTSSPPPSLLQRSQVRCSARRCTSP